MNPDKLQNIKKVLTILIVFAFVFLCVILGILRFYQSVGTILLRTILNWILGIAFPICGIAFFMGIYLGIKDLAEVIKMGWEAEFYKLIIGILWLTCPAVMIKMVTDLYVYLNVISNM